VPLDLISRVQQHELDLALVTTPPPNTQVVSEYVRTFMKRVEEQRAPLQLQLPIVLRGNEAVQE
jgi:hypothetical protein